MWIVFKDASKLIKFVFKQYISQTSVYQRIKQRFQHLSDNFITSLMKPCTFPSIRESKKTPEDTGLPLVSTTSTMKRNKTTSQKQDVQFQAWHAKIQAEKRQKILIHYSPVEWQKTVKIVGKIQDLKMLL